MSDAVIENPILNAPFREPARHWAFGDTGITNEIVEGRRVSSYFMPIPASKVRGKQLELETQWTRDRIEENRLINQIRERVGTWRSLHYPGVTPTTRRLLEYWTNESRERPLFFCKSKRWRPPSTSPRRGKENDEWIGNKPAEARRDQPPTRGSIGWPSRWRPAAGKTVVMAMLIAWHTLNKLANPQDARFSDAFLSSRPESPSTTDCACCCPTTERTTTAPRDIAPPADIERLRQARIVITNFHAFQLREAAEKCQVEYVPADSNWEHVLASRLEGMAEVHAYVKNQGLGFTIRYTFDTESRAYVPDFIARIEDGQGDDLLNLIIEVSGQSRPDKVERVATAREQWVPGVNALGRYGRWDFIEITDPWNAETAIRTHLASRLELAA